MIEREGERESLGYGHRHSRTPFSHNTGSRGAQTPGPLPKAPFFQKLRQKVKEYPWVQLPLPSSFLSI